MQSLLKIYRATTAQKYISAFMSFAKFIEKSWVDENCAENTKEVRKAFKVLKNATSSYREGIAKRSSLLQKQKKLEAARSQKKFDADSIFGCENYKKLEHELTEVARIDEAFSGPQKIKICRVAMCQLMVANQRPSAVENMELQDFVNRKNRNVIYVFGHKTQSFSPATIVLNEHSIRWIEMYLKYVRPGRLYDLFAKKFSKTKLTF